MFKKNAAGRTVKGATLIAENTRVSGDVHFSDQLFVNGYIDGNVTADADGNATLVISEVGTVSGEIKVPYVVINGSVEGDVHAGTRVELAQNAKVSGNVYYKLIEMQLGAMVDGQLVHVANDGAGKANIHPFQRGDEDPAQAGGEAKVS